ncbi:MAG: DNA polymerase III subunit delta [Clostridium sp. CAG:349_48_7]|nr:MAG: DNA polymerase III subunit delta [Clostridium sp. CAG:349_48_7]
MSKNSYPKVPWRTVKDPIAGHPRTYENGIKLDWYTTEAPAGSYRSIFKWGNPKEYKVPSEGMFNYMMKKLDFTPEFLNSKKNFGDSPVKYEIKSQLSVEEHKALLAFVAGDGADDDYTRLRVAYGQTMIDLMRLREGIVENVPDLVLYPSTTEQIENIVKYCDEHKIAIYVYSGGSSVTRGVEPTVKRSITLDLGKNFNKIISVNEINETVTVQPGIFGTALEAYLNNPSGFSVLAFSDDAIARDDFSKKASPVFKLYGKGEVVDVSGADEMQYPRIVENEVGKRNCSIENAAISLLSTYTARDMTRTMNEVNKLCAFKDGGKITKDDVENLVAADTEYKTYALADALSRGDNDRALDVLKTLLSDGESPSSILASMTAQYRRMFEARISSLSQDDLAKALSVRPGAISIAKNVAARYTPMELKKYVDTLHNLEYAFKSGEKEEAQVLYEAFAVLLKKRT